MTNTGAPNAATRSVSMSEKEMSRVEKELAVTRMLMNLLEAKLQAFMGRADLSDSPPEDKIAIRAAYFLGVADGMKMSDSITEPNEEQTDGEEKSDHHQ